MRNLARLAIANRVITKRVIIVMPHARNVNSMHANGALPPVRSVSRKIIVSGASNHAGSVRGKSVKNAERNHGMSSVASIVSTRKTYFIVTRACGTLL